MKTPTIFIYLTILFLSIGSCGSDFYIPGQANLLILEKEKDLKTSLSYNHLQLAYSPKKSIGLKADYNFARFVELTSERKLNLGTIGVGYYTHKVRTLNPKRVNNQKHPKLGLVGLEIYANLAAGRINSRTRPNTSAPFFPVPSVRSFEATIINPHISTQFYFQTRSLSINFGLRYGLYYYRDGIGFGDFSENELTMLSNFFAASPIGALLYDFQISKGNNTIETFAQVSSTTLTRSSILNSGTSFSFGLKININNLLESIKSSKKRGQKQK